MKKTDFLCLQLFRRYKLNQIYNVDKNITYSLNKKKRWNETSFDGKILISYNKNEFLLKIDYNKLKDNFYYIKDSEIKKEIIKSMSSISGYHCLRMTNKKRGKIRSEHKKEKNILRNIANNFC